MTGKIRPISGNSEDIYHSGEAQGKLVEFSLSLGIALTSRGKVTAGAIICCRILVNERAMRVGGGMRNTSRSRARDKLRILEVQNSSASERPTT